MMPVYRPDEKYFRQALQSVLHQDPGPDQMQIEVVDDCSPDVDVRGLVESIAGNRVQVFQTPRNLGLYGCWNTCIERARGDWIHLFHQDDIVLKGFYKRLGNAAAGPSEVGAAFCRHAICDDDGHWVEMSRLHRKSAGILSSSGNILGEGQHIQAPSLVIRRSIFDKIGLFRSDLDYTLDWEMYLRISERFSIWYEPEILAVWRKHGISETARLAGNGKLGADYLKFFSITSKFYTTRPNILGIARHEHSKVIALEARKLLVAGRNREAVNEIRSAYQLDPNLRGLLKVFGFYFLWMRIRLSKLKKMVLRQQQ